MLWEVNEDSLPEIVAQGSRAGQVEKRLILALSDVAVQQYNLADGEMKTTGVFVGTLRQRGNLLVCF